MKVVLSALVLTLALSPAVAGQDENSGDRDKGQHREETAALDQTSTGGIAGVTTARQGEPGQAYPPPLDLHF